jgi:hypothetical protein
VRSKQSTCLKKDRYPDAEGALRAAVGFSLPLRPYRCDRCRGFHLTSRTKGKPVPRIDRVRTELAADQ